MLVITQLFPLAVLWLEIRSHNVSFWCAGCSEWSAGCCADIQLFQNGTRHQIAGSGDLSPSSILESSSKNSASLHNTSVNEFQSYFFDKGKLGDLSPAPVSAVKSFGRESNVTFCQTACKCVVLSRMVLRESPRISQQLSKPSGRKFNSLGCGNSFLQSLCAVSVE